MLNHRGFASGICLILNINRFLSIINFNFYRVCDWQVRWCCFVGRVLGIAEQCVYCITFSYWSCYQRIGLQLFNPLNKIFKLSNFSNFSTFQLFNFSKNFIDLNYFNYIISLVFLIFLIAETF